MNKLPVPLFGNPELLEEKPSDLDALQYKNETKYVKARIDRLVDQGKHSIVAYLGPFGVGKSTLLKEVRKVSTEYEWLEFDMWRYSNRNELWDAFVISAVAKFTRGKSEFDIADEVEGVSLTRRESAAVLMWVLIIGLALTGLSYWWWQQYRGSGQFFEAYLKYAAPVIAPILLLVGLGGFLQLSFITNKRSLKRVFELEYKLFSTLKRMKKPLVIVVEDADRTGDDGRVFLETLNNFMSLKSISNFKPIVVIAPQSARAFELVRDVTTRGIESSLKIYDEKIYFNSELAAGAINEFYRVLNIREDYREKLIEASQLIIQSHKKAITIRLLKHALREVRQFIDMNPSLNPVIAISIILSRYVEVSDGVSSIVPAVQLLEKGSEYGSQQAKAFFQAIALAIDDSSQEENVKRFTLELTNGESVTLFKHQNGNIRQDIKISSVYSSLMT